MTTSAPSIAFSQTTDFRNLLNGLRLLAPAVIGGGDFNKSPPTALDPGSLPSPYLEANCYVSLLRCITYEGNPPTTPAATIDYAYSTICRTRNGAVYDLVHSDHEVLQGFFGGC
jgi:hypothetical protein